MRLLSFTVSVALLVSVCAATNSTGRTSTPHKAGYERMMRASGGLINKPGSLQGQVLVVNAQKIISTDKIREAGDVLEKLMRINLKTIDGDVANVKTALSEARKLSANAWVVVVSDADFPQRIAYLPDENVAIVNVTPLGADNPKPPVLNARAAKEVARALCYACGAGTSAHEGTLMSNKTSVNDLDQMVDIKYPMDVVTRMRSYLNTLGVTPAIKVPYIRACREGWAPAPTNEYQKAVWDKVHALPTEPLKIKPETKKVGD